MDRPATASGGIPERVPERTVIPVRSLLHPEQRGNPGRGVEPTLASYAWAVIDGRWTVAAALFAALVLGVAYLFVATPIYGAKAVVQVEQKRRTAAGVDDLTAALGESPPAEPEIEIIRSRMLIGTVLDQLQLDLEARPRTFPIVGRAIARRHGDPAPAQPLLGLGRFAWGGERIRVERLQVPAHLVDVPLLLTVEEGGRYTISQDDARLLEGGAVGRSASAGDGPSRLELQVSELIARPGTQFWIRRRDREHVIDAVQAELRVQEKGRRSGILVIEFQGSSATGVSDLVNGIATAYLRQNVERRSAEAAKTLEFLETQIPKVKANVDAAEGALNAYRVRSGTVDTPTEARGVLERVAQLEKEIADAEVRRSELRQAFTENHPNLMAVANKLALLRSEHASLSARMRTLPQAELNSARLQRELQDATELYVSLLNKAQELRVAKSGTLGDVRIIDRAHVPDLPLSPNAGAVLVLTLLLGLAGGIAAAVLRRSWVKRAEGPDDVEAATGVPVYVTIPHSDAQAQLARSTSRKRRALRPLLSVAVPDDVAIETLRSLRTSLQFALVESRNNIVAMTGLAPAVGKSFIAANLAHVLAAAERRVLLVDCDLRRGCLHRQFGVDRQPGVSDVVSGIAALDASIRRVEGGQLHLLPSGRIPPNPAELLASQRFETLLAEASARFDLVIVDTPPLLAVTDAMLVARFAGVNFLVLRSGQHTSRELAHGVKEFALNGIKLHGTVLNDVPATRSGRYGRDGYVRYAYSSDASD